MISACLKGDLTCARAAELLWLSAPSVKRLKKRMGEEGEAVLAHVSRGRPSPRRLPDRVRQQVVRLARTCCFHHERIVNDNVVQWDGLRFHIPPHPQRFSLAGAKVRLHQSLDGNIAIYHQDAKLHHIPG